MSEESIAVKWENLVAAEPRLEQLRQRAYQDGRQNPLKKQVLWCGTYKAELHGLVGFYSENKDHPLLGTSTAYTVASGVVGDALHLGLTEPIYEA